MLSSGGSKFTRHGRRRTCFSDRMNEFTFNKAFRRELRESPHHYGEVAFLESVLQPGMTVIEGGANRGVTAVAIAKCVGANGDVHAFEPVSEYFEMLQANIKRNKSKIWIPLPISSDARISTRRMPHTIDSPLTKNGR